MVSDRERDIIERILLIESRLKRARGGDRLGQYNTGDKVHAKQMQFHRCLKRNRWVFGGNRSGKTECGAVEVVWMARGIHPFRENRKNVSGWVVSLSHAVQREVAQSKIMQYLNEDWIDRIVMASGSRAFPAGGIIDYITVKNVFGGISKIAFKTCEMGREKFQGASLDFVWFDEEPPREIYDECRMRVIDRCGEVFGTMTPLKGLTFVYNKIFLNEDNDPNVWHIMMEWADNPYLDGEEIKAVSVGMSDEELKVRRYGQFCSCGGLVYGEFNENVHVIEPFDVPKEWYDNISIDPGLNNPLSAHWYAVDGDGVVYVIAEHYEKGRDIGYHADMIKRISAALLWHGDGKGRIKALIDSAANQRTLSSSKSVSELFYEMGICVNSNVNKDLFSGISRVKSYLKGENGSPKLYIFNTCKNLIREIKGYFWGEDDVPKKRDDHALDELRYYICSKPQTNPVEKSKSLIELDKERMMRRGRGRKG